MKKWNMSVFFVCLFVFSNIMRKSNWKNNLVNETELGDLLHAFKIQSRHKY